METHRLVEFSSKWKPGCGLYDDRYTFHLVGYEYDQVTNGDIYIHNALAGQFRFF